MFLLTMTFTLKKLLLIGGLIPLDSCYITYDRTMYSSPVKKDGDSTSSSTSSPARSRHNAGLSPRQRRLLQAAKRAKAKNNIIGTDDKTTNTSGDHNIIEDSKVAANNNSSSFICSIPSSPASPTTIQNTSPTKFSVGSTPINELKSSLSSISPIQHQSSIGDSSSPAVLSTSRPIHEFNTPPQKISSDDSMKYSSVGITTSKSTNRSNTRLNRSSNTATVNRSNNAASSNIASIDNSLQRLSIKPSARDTTSTQRSRSNSHEQRLKINSKWQATANKYNHVIPPPSPSRGSPGSVEEQYQQGVEDVKYEVGTGEDGSPTLNVVRGNVSDRIRKFSSSPSTRNDLDQIQETSKLIHVRPVGEHKKKTIGESSIQREESQMKRGPMHEENIADLKYVKQSINPAQKTSRPVQKLRHEIPRNDIQQTKPQRNPSDENIRKSQQWHRTVNQQQQQQSSQKQIRYPSDENIGSGNELRYYRITFRGVVSLISSLDDIQQSKTETNIQNKLSEAKTKIYTGYGEILGTTSPEIIIPLPKKNDNNDDGSNSEKKQTFARAIRVDSILTGGYGTDLIDSLDLLKSVDESITNHSEGHYGYLLLTSQQSIIAKPLPSSISTSLQSTTNTKYQTGQFTYRVSSSSPIQVLSGPAVDATPLGMGLLPDTVHEVSFRITIPLSLPEDNYNDRLGSAGIDDTFGDDEDPAGEITFLRLSKRRGWLADRRVDVIDDHKLRVSYLMHEEEDEQSTSLLGGRSLQSQSFEDTSSLNSSALNSTANSSFYASVVASSVATPTNIKTRRRRNRRGVVERSRVKPLTSASLPSAVVREHNNHSSFEEAGSSITGGGTDVASHPSVSIDEPQTKSFYLMRVLAPHGLKILDAPHFQVSSLIHSPSPHKLMNPRHSPTSPGISPFARTNAMIGSAENSPTQTSIASGRKRLTPRVRFLPRGQIFEALSRMDNTGDSSLYTNGQGLIKLADGSGWAIVPHQQDLIKGNHANTSISSFESINAYEEIGNAVIPFVQSSQQLSQQYRMTPPKQHQQMQDSTLLDRSLKDVVWLRIAAPLNGIKVLLPPPQEQKSINANSPHVQKRETPPKHGVNTSTSQESEVASSVVSNSFFDSVWSRVTPSKDRGPQHDNGQTKLRLPQNKQQQQQPVIPVIPCGMVVPVEPWDTSTSTKSFSRLFNGQGWIPRCLGEEVYAYEVSTPDIRVGSFWFRVKSQSGLDVKHGPSQYAPVIKADDNTSFRFECGEFLRASELLTVFNKRSHDGEEDDTSESFAKLYRRRNHKQNNIDGDKQPLLDRFSSLQSIVSPGEWVQVHGNGQLLLEECTEAPVIERNRIGWKYTVICNAVYVHSGPSLHAKLVDELIFKQEIIVIEKVTGSWLRLKTGGWVCSTDKNGQEVVQQQQGGLNNGSTDQHSQRMVRRILNRR